MSNKVDLAKLDYTFERPLIQGDVILKRLKSLPKGLEKQEMTVENQSKVLQYSEVTGHHHHFKPTAPVDLFILEGQEPITGRRTITPNDHKFIIVYEDTKLYHGKGFEDVPLAKGVGEHEALSVPPGIYYIDIAREYDYDANETTRVSD